VIVNPALEIRALQKFLSLHRLSWPLPFTSGKRQMLEECIAKTIPLPSTHARVRQAMGFCNRALLPPRLRAGRRRFH